MHRRGEGTACGAEERFCCISKGDELLQPSEINSLLWKDGVGFADKKRGGLDLWKLLM